MNGARRLRFCALEQTHIGSVDPDALRIPALRAEYSLAESAFSPFHAEPTHLPQERLRSTKGPGNISPREPRPRTSLPRNFKSGSRDGLTPMRAPTLRNHWFPDQWCEWSYAACFTRRYS